MHCDVHCWLTIISLSFSVLEWKSGQFVSADVALHQQAVADTSALSVHLPLRQEISRVVARHVLGGRAQHILLVRVRGQTLVRSYAEMHSYAEIHSFAEIHSCAEIYSCYDIHTFGEMVVELPCSTQ